MSAKYIIRLDDACPVNDQRKWSKVEALLDENNLCPAVAVIPDNQDKDFFYQTSDDDFWSRAAGWEKKGWVIGLHGYQHKYLTKEKGLVGFNKKSEFAGLSYEKQKVKIQKGYNFLLEKGIKPNIWVAPAHTFDDNTLKALLETTEIRTISDGYAFYPYFEKQFLWIPQVLPWYRFQMFGVFTICLHPHFMDDNKIDKFGRILKQHRKQFFDYSFIIASYRKVRRKKTVLDNMLYRYYVIREILYKKMHL